MGATTISPQPPPPRRVVCDLQASALAAICTLTTNEVDPARDPNPHTATMTVYDLARLFNLDPSGTSRNSVVELDDIATIIALTSGPPQRRQKRALWVASELRRLGYVDQVSRFEQLAEQ